MNYKPLIVKLFDFYLGEIRGDVLKDYFVEWARKNNYPLPKMFKLLKDTAYNSEGDIIPIVQETDMEIYYNDSCHRYCYLNKSEEGCTFEFIRF